MFTTGKRKLKLRLETSKKKRTARRAYALPKAALETIKDISEVKGIPQIRVLDHAFSWWLEQVSKQDQYYAGFLVHLKRYAREYEENSEKAMVPAWMSSDRAPLFDLFAHELQVKKGVLAYAILSEYYNYHVEEIVFAPPPPGNYELITFDTKPPEAKQEAEAKVPAAPVESTGTEPQTAPVEVPEAAPAQPAMPAVAKPVAKPTGTKPIGTKPQQRRPLDWLQRLQEAEKERWRRLDQLLSKKRKPRFL